MEAEYQKLQEWAEWQEAQRAEYERAAQEDYYRQQHEQGQDPSMQAYRDRVTSNDEGWEGGFSEQNF